MKSSKTCEALEELLRKECSADRTTLFCYKLRRKQK